ncbi:MAG: CNNM domain-containing protein [Thermodesulfobacteriota bacterium]|nr:CNNM domain-containing protein [Thermodesulfobacteriota bacterium]
MEGTQDLLMYLLVVFFLICSAFFSGAETALLSLSRLRTKQLKKDKPVIGKAIEKILSEPDQLIGTILVGNNIANVAGTALATGISISIFGKDGMLIAATFMTFLFLIFSEITPKTYAAYNALKFSLVAIYPIRLFMYIFSPIVWVTSKVSTLLLILTGHRGKSRWSPITEEEIETLIEVGEEEGAFEPKKGRMLSGIFDLTDLTLEDVMVPIKDVVTVEISTPLEEIERVITQNAFSRYPVYEKEINNMLGYIHVKDFFKAKNRSDFMIKDVLRQPLFVPETKVIFNQLRDFQRERAHIAFVVDEYGEIRGIVSMEDIIEEIIGEIYDESDLIKSPYLLQKDGSVIVNSNMKIRDINRLLKIRLPEEDNPTLGALILKEMERIPEEGEELAIGSYKINISTVEDRSIGKVSIKKEEMKDPEEEDFTSP